jgi:hypothetical protein
VLRLGSLSADLGWRKAPVAVRLDRRARRLKPELEGLGLAAGRLLPVFGYLVIPAVILSAYFILALQGPLRMGEPAFGWDFRATWEGAGEVLAGESPYPRSAALLTREDQFVYPPAAAVAIAPLRLFPSQTAAVLFAILSLACAFATLRVLGVRDWRCYGVVAAWIPVLESARLGAISLLLTFVAALAWRYRDSWLVSAAAVAGLIAVKVFLWPLALWFAVTGRVRQACTSVLLALLATLGAWWLIGFEGLRAYPQLLGALSDSVAWKSYSALSLGLSLGLSGSAAKLLSIALGCAVLGAVIVFGRRARNMVTDRHAFTAAVGAALLLSPILWTHYFALLLVPLAIARPRIGPLWLLPLLFWISPGQSEGELWRIVLGLVVGATVLAGTATDLGAARERGRSATSRPGFAA